MNGTVTRVVGLVLGLDLAVVDSVLELKALERLLHILLQTLQLSIDGIKARVCIPHHMLGILLLALLDWCGYELCSV